MTRRRYRSGHTPDRHNADDARCPHCNGTGDTRGRVCRTCDGTGTVVGLVRAGLVRQQREGQK